MKRVACSIQPFVLKQTILIYNEEGKLDKATTSTIGNLANTIWETCRANLIDQVELSGSRIFTGRTKQELTKISKYCNVDLTINVH